MKLYETEGFVEPRETKLTKDDILEGLDREIAILDTSLMHLRIIREGIYLDIKNEDCL